MYINLDLFAEMLGVRPGALLQAIRTDGILDGLSLPRRRQVSGTATMFFQDEAIAFLKLWKTRSSKSSPPDAGEPLITLDAFSRKAGVEPQALWRAAGTVNSLRGVALPLAVKSYGSQLMFSAREVEQFIADYGKALTKG